jgi:hypothetical protein
VTGRGLNLHLVKIAPHITALRPQFCYRYPLFARYMALHGVVAKPYRRWNTQIVKFTSIPEI